ncbi:large conductance mechanosensitive channel protein MscL [Microbacterium sp. C7(2022)]|uniref:large conductance mechanosensitive channel protein MscL n=1 Tax=Microbacterium sp. C7(2022) TaxID=2992759 RepID=UPI00237ABE22|nr:large conductance mechanosensitive channel protein MscL [Microbacterium sp. C7(2022)]MDE0547087.1 large conductance mechanosensitive channel protein MscL [Microbacterium sp. C7(2022)]
MIQGFKEFIFRGNVIDLAVAVVIGAAFTAIVTVVVESLINPLVSLFFAADSLATALTFTVPTLFGGTATFSFGAILAAVLSFLSVAVVVYFVFVLPMNKARERSEAKKGVVADETALPTETELLIEIRDLLRAQQGQAPRA